MSAQRIAVAFDAAAQHLAGFDDWRTLIVAAVEHMPPEGVAELLARLIEAHPEGAGMVRVLVAWRPTESLLLRIGSISSLGWVEDTTGGGWSFRPSALERGPAPVARSFPTRDAAEAALIAAQPVPAAVVRVRS